MSACLNYKGLRACVRMDPGFAKLTVKFLELHPTSVHSRLSQFSTTRTAYQHHGTFCRHNGPQVLKIHQRSATAIKHNWLEKRTACVTCNVGRYCTPVHCVVTFIMMRSLYKPTRTVISDDRICHEQCSQYYS